MSKRESVRKYPSQIDEMNAIDKIFSKTLKQRKEQLKFDPLLIYLVFF